MIATEKLKEIGDRLIGRSKTNLSIDGYVSPLLIVLKNDGNDVETVDLPMADADEKRQTRGLIVGKSAEAGVEALVLLMEIRVSRISVDEKTPDTLKGDDRACDAIYLAIFTREETLMHQVMFSKAVDGTPAFLPSDWIRSVEGEGTIEIDFIDDLMCNPWTAEKK